jgi:hypothetical protein
MRVLDRDPAEEEERGEERDPRNVIKFVVRGNGHGSCLAISRQRQRFSSAEVMSSGSDLHESPSGPGW